MDSCKSINIAEKLKSFDDHWHPRIVAGLNGQHVKVAKLFGEFDWHTHDDEDELFLIVDGELEMHLEDQPTVTLRSGEMLVVPRGVKHKPVARVETHVLLFEPASTVNTGDSPSDRTRGDLDWI
ncbi:MAG: cupin domain-containing protein [Planctomycetota bacterium]